MSTERSSFATLMAGFIFVLVAAAIVFAPSTPSVRAQSAGPQVYITWRTVDGSAPQTYQGKILPKTNATVAASVEVITASGKLADLSSQVIYWYLDDQFIGGGVGHQTTLFSAPGNNETMSLRVNIPNYPSGQLVNTSYIRMVNPQVVIVAPYPYATFSGNSVEVTSYPYFFTLDELLKLRYQWSVNGQAVTTQENPLDLIVNLTGDTPAGYSLGINFGAQVSDDPYTSAGSRVTLTHVRQ